MLKQKLKVKRVLFFDSGVGGLSIFKAVKDLNPDIEAYYLFDNECFPYGDKSEDFLIKRVELLLRDAIAQFSLSAIVIACNTASTIALSAVREKIHIPIIGVVPAIKPAAIKSKKKFIALLATPGTVHRAYTEDLIEHFAQGCKILKIGSSELANIAERRLSEGVVDKAAIARILEPITSLGDKGPDTIVLGCTHYPFVADIIKEVLPNVKQIDSGEAIGRRVKDILSQSNIKEIEVEDRKDRSFYTGSLLHLTDREKMVKCFGFESLEKFKNL